MTCDNRVPDKDDTDEFLFAPAFIAAMKADGQEVEFEGRCFKSIKIKYNDQKDSTGLVDEVKFTVTTSEAKSLLCHDWFLFATREGYHVEDFFFAKTSEITFNGFKKDQQIDLGFNGFDIYNFCDGYIDSFISLLKTLSMFLGGLSPDPNLPIIGSHVPDYMIDANLHFLKETMDITMEKREIQTYDYDENLIQSGDFFVVMRLDGLDQIIELGTGSHSGHSVMGLRFDGELYIVESQGGWYWPNKGLQRTPWNQWKQWAANADFHVVHCPLSDANRAKFDEKAANEFFFQTEGLPYGYHNFLFSWVDTPADNWPPVLAAHLVPIAFGIVQSVNYQTADIMMNQALNHRLGTTGLGMSDITATAAEKNMSVSDVMA